MADTPIRKLVDRGLGPNLRQLQRVGDGQSDPGAGMTAARAMTSGAGGLAQDASTQGGLRSETAAKYARLPLLGTLIARHINTRGGGTVQ